jgi:isopenicillin N synthase-like dioxygenase
VLILQSLHDKVLDPLHTLLALALELPEDFFVNLHKYQNNSEDHLRYMKYGRFSEQEQDALAKGDGLWSYGHTDLGTLTLLFRQPVAALQIKDHETGDWKWAKPLDGSLTVNTCDALSFLTGNYIKSTVHRVRVFHMYESGSQALTIRCLFPRKTSATSTDSDCCTLRDRRTILD